MPLLKRATRHINARGVDLQVKRGTYGPYLYDPQYRKQTGTVYRTVELAIAAALAGERPANADDPRCPFCGAALHARMCQPQRDALGPPANHDDALIVTLREQLDDAQSHIGALVKACEEGIARIEDVAERGCDCLACEECGEMPHVCTGTPCAQTCGCTPCDACKAAASIAFIAGARDAARAWLRRKATQ